MGDLKDIIKLIRPQQWVKNFFIFLPMFFYGSILDWTCWRAVLCSFGAFSFIASSIYCLNDIHDIESDKKHPKKCSRPIASGKISIFTGYITLLMCLIISAAILLIAFSYCAIENPIEVTFCCCLYWILNILYTFYLKKIAIIDIFIVAFGFVIRVFIGGFSTGIPISHWIVLLTFLLSLFLALSKRRDDVLLYEMTGEKVRYNVSRYSIPFLNLSISIIASIVIVCYIMYTVSDEVILRVGSPYLYVTSVFVIAGIIRYLQLTIVDSKSGSPTKILLKDRFIQLCILCWIILFVLILYA